MKINLIKKNTLHKTQSGLIIEYRELNDNDKACIKTIKLILKDHPIILELFIHPKKNKINAFVIGLLLEKNHWDNFYWFLIKIVLNLCFGLEEICIRNVISIFNDSEYKDFLKAIHIIREEDIKKVLNTSQFGFEFFDTRIKKQNEF